MWYCHFKTNQILIQIKLEAIKKLILFKNMSKNENSDILPSFAKLQFLFLEQQFALFISHLSFAYVLKTDFFQNCYTNELIFLLFITYVEQMQFSNNFLELLGQLYSTKSRTYYQPPKQPETYFFTFYRSCYVFQTWILFI